MLDALNHLHENIKLVHQIGSSVSFLDVLIENKDGILATSVFHQVIAEPTILPFTSDHPRHVFAHIIDGALLRAVRYSSTLPIFQKEQRSLQLMLLCRGFVHSNSFFFSFMFQSFSLFAIGIHHDTFTTDSSNFSNHIFIRPPRFYLCSAASAILTSLVLIYSRDRPRLNVKLRRE